MLMSLSVYYPHSQVSRKVHVKDVFIVIAASILIALFSKVAIPLPFSPVPLVMQCSICIFLAAALGSVRGAAAVALFLAEGAMGFPVFANGAGGIVHFFGPTGGYLVGYLAGAYLTGYLVERAKIRTAGKVFLSMAAGNLVVFFFGVTWLSTFVGLSSAIVLGFLPFIVGDALKLMLASRGLKALGY